jgi:dynein heavy chain
MKDLFKVLQGILQIRPTSASDDENTLIKLWCHETSRVFRDRIFDAADQSFFDGLIRLLLQKHFQVVDDNSLHRRVILDNYHDESILFGEYMEKDEGNYVQITGDMFLLEEILLDYLEDYNNSTAVLKSSSEMQLVFFPDAIQHLSRLCRLLRQPKGNALLIGLQGSGRRSLTKLATHMTNATVFQIQVYKGYGKDEFHEDLKKVIMLAGIKQQAVTFLLSEDQIIQESFFEDINALLCGNEVPNLFEKPEIEKIIAQMQRYVPAQSSKEAVWEFFLNRVFDKLHIVLCMNPIGDTFRTRYRMFPSLLHSTTVDWYLEWPEHALYSVASRIIQTYYFNVLDGNGSTYDLGLSSEKVWDYESFIMTFI